MTKWNTSVYIIQDIRWRNLGILKAYDTIMADCQLVCWENMCIEWTHSGQMRRYKFGKKHRKHQENADGKSIERGCAQRMNISGSPG